MELHHRKLQLLRWPAGMMMLALVLCFIDTYRPVKAQGLEDFNHSNAPSSYTDGTFDGNAGIVWNYVHSRSEGVYPIDGGGLMLRRASDSKIESGTIAGGIGNFSVNMRKAYTTNADRQLELLINGVSKGYSDAFGSEEAADSIVHTFDVQDINVAGNFILEIRNALGGSTNAQISIDNISWTGYTSGDPIITTNPLILNELSYQEGEGPSGSISFTINAQNLVPATGDIIIKGSENYRVSVDSNTFHASGLLSYTDGSVIDEMVAVRLKGGLNTGKYDDETIVLTGGEADSAFISLSGSVKEPPPVLGIDGYEESFRDFISLETLPGGWTISDDSYNGDWRTGAGAGVRGNDNVLGYQHTGTTGEFVIALTLPNETGRIIENLNISYSGKVGRINMDRNPEWSVEVAGVESEPLHYTTATGEDEWVQTSITGLSIAEGENITIKWSSNGDVPGSGARRQIGISEVSVSAFEGEPLNGTRLEGNRGFRMLSSPTATSFQSLLHPVWTQGMRNANTTKGEANVWTWDKTSTGGDSTNWMPLTDLDTPTVTGIGVLVFIFENNDGDIKDEMILKELSVKGTENSLPLSIPINKNSKGFSFVGNPTASNLSWDDMSVNGLDDVIYRWDPNKGETGGWLTWSKGAGDLTGGIIHPFQGFFTLTSVGAENPSLEITEMARINDSPPAKEVEQEEPLVIRLQLEGEDLQSSTWLRFSEKGELGRDRGDGLKLQPLSSEYALLATKLDSGSLLDINHLPLVGKELELPLLVNATQNGPYQLRTTKTNLPHDWNVTLTDNRTGEVSHLNTEANYLFEINTTAEETVLNWESFVDNDKLKAKNGGLEERFVLTITRGEPTGTARFEGELPLKITLRQNYPNPFNPSTSIGYDLPEAAFVRLSVFDILGREIATLAAENKSAGFHRVSWDAGSASSGIYLYRLEVGRQVLTGRMMLIN